MSRKKAPQLGIILGTGERIRKIRGRLTQSEFGKLLGVKGNTVSRWEAGRLSDDETLKKIADHGGVTVEWLLHGDQAAARTGEHAPDTYEARPAALNLDYLARSIHQARSYLKSKRLHFTAAQEAEFISYLYEYWQETHRQPDQVMVSRLADLIPKPEE